MHIRHFNVTKFKPASSIGQLKTLQAKLPLTITGKLSFPLGNIVTKALHRGRNIKTQFWMSSDFKAHIFQPPTRFSPSVETYYAQCIAMRVVIEQISGEGSSSGMGSIWPSGKIRKFLSHPGWPSRLSAIGSLSMGWAEFAGNLGHVSRSPAYNWRDYRRAAGVHFSKLLRTFRARKHFGALFGCFSRVPKSVSQNARKYSELSADIFGNLFVFTATIERLELERLFLNTSLLLQLLIILCS